jgi:hypothetical protein
VVAFTGAAIANGYESIAGGAIASGAYSVSSRPMAASRRVTEARIELDSGLERQAHAQRVDYVSGAREPSLDRDDLEMPRAPHLSAHVVSPVMSLTEFVEAVSA